MKILKKLIWLALALEIIVLLVVVANSNVDNMTLSKGEIYDFNSGWTITREDGSSKKIKSLPYSEKSKAGEKIILSNTIPKKYSGMTMSFLSADKQFRVTIDGKQIYEFGVNDSRPFGKTPGSVTNFIDIPENLSEGKIEIEMISPYDNYASNITSITISRRDTSILNLLKSNLGNFAMCIIILACGITLFMLAFIQAFSRQTKDGISYLGFMCVFGTIYFSIETKSLSIFYGNQTLYSNLVFLVLMLWPVFMQMYYINNLEEKFQKIFYVLLFLTLTNVACQLTLQILGIFDFMNMAFVSHILIFISGMAILFSLICTVCKTRDKLLIIEFLGMSAFIIGSAADLIRTYTIHIGDFGKYSRFGMTIFSLLMVFVHILKVIRGYSASIAENARHMEMEVQVIEEKNQELTIANEEAEKAKAEAIAAANAKSVFLANMSHEIRTPINAILGMDTMILRESTDKDILEYAGNIQSASQTLLSLINDILDFSKIETGKLELVQGDYALSSLINDVYHMLLGKAKEKGLALNVESDKNLPAKLYGDEVRIRQIIVNILNNAIKYTEKGSVTLKVGMSEQTTTAAITSNKATTAAIDIENESNLYNNNTPDSQATKNIIITFTITDTGIGIKQENIPHLFDSFSRFDENKNKHIEGTGLGLAITKQLTELMSGRIKVTSEYGKGSVFEVSIPQKVVSDLKIGDISEKYNAAPDKKKKKALFTAPDAKVLVVDDVKMNINVFKALLKRTEISVASAMSGPEALEMIKENKYDIIFLDHMMPDMDGIETYKHMKELEQNPNKDTTVIMLTANAIMGAKEEYIGIGFSDYLSKPVQAPKLEAMILKYLPEELVTKTDK
ncbi:response regulator [Eubacterium sp. MSJ-13]|uniref:response regulator n=1 Tax=Eubacterium sp. MSJ-13 TaxID=2841513 RepID=UPI001C11312B|nr:response regulator [Eubacterium sp. MSJ-13]MBU5477951.1 response regulator [Eubacterium sp. MSJ-13]